MSSSPGNPGQKKEVRLLLEPFNRSRSQSPSHSSLQHGSIVSLIAAGSDKGDGLGTNQTMQESSVENEAIISRPAQPAQKSQNVAWDGLRGSLQTLRDSSNDFPLLSSAVDSLLSCVDGLEEMMRNRPDFEALATKLDSIVQSLKLSTEAASGSIIMSRSVAGITLAIEREVKKVRDRLNGTPTIAMRAGTGDEEEVVRCYQQINDLFRRLQMNTDMGAGSDANERIANTKLEGLNPAKRAAYDSSLAGEISRRGCTADTRTEILNDLDEWLHNPKSSSIYWMNGMAGTGKTTIASTFCGRVEQRELLAASFFCTRSSAECRNAGRIVPTIAYQLALYSIPFQSALCKMIERNSDIVSRNMSTQFELLLKEPLLQVKDTVPDNLVVVVDALDECEDSNGVELVLDMLFSHATHVPLKFLVLSRPEQEIYGKMSAHAQFREVLHLHEIEKSLVQADIELYLKAELKNVSPNQAQIEQLAQRSGSLFIYAATLARYICGKRSTDSHKRIEAILSMTLESTKKHTEIDALYTTVLKSALSEAGQTSEKAKDIQVVLWTVVLAQEPIDVETITKLADIDDSLRVVYALQTLRSVLHQSEENGPVSTLHASFPDFMFSKERSGLYSCDITGHSQLLAQRCSLVMTEQLRFNICDLASSFILDQNVDDIQERVKTKISPTLAYACRYWASHLVLAPKSGSLLKTLDEFLSCQLLFWMEVLSLRRELPMAVDGLLKAQRWLTRPDPPSPELLLFVDDARSFVTEYAVNSSSNSTPHIYVSSLALCPQSNSVYKCYHKRLRGSLTLKGSLMERREAAPLATWTVGSEISSLALSPDGTRVAIGCLDGTISILSAYDGMVHVGPVKGHSNTVNSVAFSPDGGRVVSASLGGIRVWNVYNGAQVAGPFKGHMRYINSVSFSPNGTRIVSCGHDSTIRIWNADDGTQLIGPLTDHTDLVLCVAFSPDGGLIASSSADQTVRLWNPYDGTPASVPFRGHAGSVDFLSFTPDGTRLVSGGGSNKAIRVWDTYDGEVLMDTFEGYTGSVSALATSPDSLRVAAACNDNAVRVWRIDNGKLVAGPFFGHSDTIKSVAFTPDGTRIFSCSVDKTIRVWNVRDGMFPPLPLPPQNALSGINTVIFCPDSTHFLSSSGPAVLRMWDATEGSFVTIPEEANFFPTPLSILSPNGSYIASTSKDGRIQISSTANGSLVAGPFDVERSLLSAFWFSHNNKAIIMGCKDGTVKVCNLQKGNTTVGSFRGHHRGVSSLAESPDCSLLVSYSDFEFVLRVWNVDTPPLNLQRAKIASLDSKSSDRYDAIYEGWEIMEDGWVVNNRRHLLFWLPPDIASVWCSPYAALVITRSGTLQVPEQRPLIGDEWIKCYIAE